MRLLLAEDEKELNRALTAMLKHEKYEVDSVFDGEEALDYIISGEYDAVILDIMMPRISGLEVLKKLRKEKIAVPVLLLTAKSQIEDKIEGLDLGADDYLTKPFVRGELMARLRALTRRAPVLKEDVLNFGDVKLNVSASELLGPSGQVRLNNKEFQVMEMLFNNPGIFLSSEQLMDKIWGYDTESQISVVWAHISFLRKKLETIESNVVIEAARGIGYRLENKND